jgi:hypothetical protein
MLKVAANGIYAKDDCFSCYAILKELIECYSKNNVCKKNLFIIMAALYTVFKGITGILSRFIEGKAVLGDSKIESALIILIMIHFMVVYYTTVPIVLLGVLDLRRTNFMLEQMALILAPRKLCNLD